MNTVDIIIPTYKPSVECKNLIKRLIKQTYSINKIIIINTEAEYWDKSIEEISEKIQVTHIKKSEFDHGKTRNMAAKMSNADIVVFMTQDAKPFNEYTIEELVRPFSDEGVYVSYARQAAKPDCNEIEKYTRTFNYPYAAKIKSKEDLPKLGIKTYFCSNSCAAYRKSVFEKLGGFEEKIIFGEDMIFAAKVIEENGKIAYASKSVVIHSHNYTVKEQFKRNFDIGVNQRDHKRIFKNVKSESEGVKLVVKTASHLIEIHEYLWIGFLVVYSGAKFIGYKMGYNYKKLPIKLVKKCSMKPDYFKEH